MDSLILLAAATVAITTVLLIVGIYRVAGGGESVAIRRLVAMRPGAPATRESLVPQVPLVRQRLSAIPLLDLLLGGSRRFSQMAADLDRAGLQLRVSEYAAIRVIFAVLFFIAVLVLSGTSLLSLLIALLASSAGYLLPWLYVRSRQARRLHKLERQLAETLTLMATALKAGFGFLQAIDAAARQMQPPISEELDRTLRDANLGASIEDALKALNSRVRSADLDLAITAILIQREVGGNLAEILENVAHTIRERDRIKGEVKTLTTTQRWEGYVAALVPVALAGLLFLINPDYMMVLLEEPMGRLLLTLAAVWELVGFLVMRRLVAIDF